MMRGGMGEGGMGMMRGGSMGQSDMGMMGRKSGRMEPMGNGPDEEEENSDEE
jgi:hypothetical protein